MKFQIPYLLFYGPSLIVSALCARKRLFSSLFKPICAAREGWLRSLWAISGNVLRAGAQNPR